MKFKELPTSASFDFISPISAHNSFFDRCIKTGPRSYTSLATGAVYKVGSINCEVFHVTDLTPFKKSQWEATK